MEDIEDLLEDLLVQRLCQRNGWEYGGNEDYDNAVRDVKWFLSQPEILSKTKALEEARETVKAYIEDIKKAGRKEVVEWVREHQLPDTPNSEPYRGLVVISKVQLEAKLKELGVVLDSVTKEG